MSDNAFSSKADLSALLAQLSAEMGGESGRRPPPVDAWDPPYCGLAGFTIKRDGTWLHEGQPIRREPMVRLFSSILRKDLDGRTYLVTPAEKILVEIEDAPFLAVRADRLGQGEDQMILFTTNLGDAFLLDEKHPMRVAVDGESGAPRPYVLVRGRLEALMTRAAYLEIANWAEAGDDGWGVWSAGRFWPLE